MARMNKTSLEPIRRVLSTKLFHSVRFFFCNFNGNSPYSSPKGSENIFVNNLHRGLFNMMGMNIIHVTTFFIIRLDSIPGFTRVFHIPQVLHSGVSSSALKMLTLFIEELKPRDPIFTYRPQRFMFSV